MLPCSTTTRAARQLGPPIIFFHRGVAQANCEGMKGVEGRGSRGYFMATPSHLQIVFFIQRAELGEMYADERGSCQRDERSTRDYTHLNCRDFKKIRN